MGVSRPPRRPSGDPAAWAVRPQTGRPWTHKIVLNNCTKHKEKTETNKKCGAEIKIARCGGAHVHRCYWKPTALEYCGGDAIDRSTRACVQGRVRGWTEEEALERGGRPGQKLREGEVQHLVVVRVLRVLPSEHLLPPVLGQPRHVALDAPRLARRLLLQPHPRPQRRLLVVVLLVLEQYVLLLLLLLAVLGRHRLEFVARQIGRQVAIRSRQNGAGLDKAGGVNGHYGRAHLLERLLLLIGKRGAEGRGRGRRRKPA
eukprot:scaffold4021_cov59-Phaeocystis_antarctica.AAC.2